MLANEITKEVTCFCCDLSTERISKTPNTKVGSARQWPTAKSSKLSIVYIKISMPKMSEVRAPSPAM